MYQMHAFYPWLQPTTYREQFLGQALPYWLPSMVNRSLVDLTFSFTLGVCTGVLNLYVRTESQAWYWYAASLSFTLAHLVFSREALHRLQAAGRVEGAGQENLKALEKWLRMNKIRFLISEVPAFVTSLVAVFISLEAA
ncbi:hypothetical protein P153DRAFT_382094 [Dothidotthia symphoricarpi CBS 119687]|uniref:DUF1772-domain-containing protein n=1 Tax=Dothidotthia symphoricarpi CBS 119687 TaxID=1392245 RepID=A0A6A6AKJ2_9PLEO|nr:uncharacterized protein P153DRAFT_382094 [Dothidotthia symphoricarpi CBS 119687]KAF2132469.1 hypothetical protein P153DRAFT_382094 [Dothidotthia symphoricarpi CBS 119687]